MKFKVSIDLLCQCVVSECSFYESFPGQLTFLRDNMLINDNVLHISHLTNVKKVISCLSTCVFPDKVEYPLDEDKVHLCRTEC